LLFEDILKRVTQSIHIMKVTVKVKLLPTVDEKQALLKTMEHFNHPSDKSLSFIAGQTHGKC